MDEPVKIIQKKKKRKAIKKKKDIPKEPQKRGRKKIKIDYDRISRLAQINLTQEHIADIEGISVRTLLRDPIFCQTYKRAKTRGAGTLLQKQWEVAMEGNTTMLIWLGKQYLGQRDKQELEHSGEIKATKSINLSNLSYEELKVLDEITKKIENIQ